MPPGADPALAVDALRSADWTSVAVRSSAVEEDGEQHSFAGMFTSVLGVSTPEDLRTAIATCRASASSPRIQAYRAEHGLSEAPIAVIVQEMVEGNSSGVLFTRDPSRPPRRAGRASRS